MQLYWSAVTASIAAVTADNAAVTADNAAAKICFHIGHVGSGMQLPYSGYRFLGSGYRFPKKRLPLPQEAVTASPRSGLAVALQRY